MGENYKVIIRNIRRDMMEQMKKIEKEALITEDDLKKESENIQKLTDKYVNKIDDIIRDKEKAIMEI
jgi:ribosome recycling factor